MKFYCEADHFHFHSFINLCISQLHLPIYTKTINWCVSSRREVLIRILALLQRKTLTETKNRTLKCLKWHHSTVDQWKMLQCFVPTRGIWQLKCPHPREFAIQGQKNANARGQSGWGGLGAGGIDWCIIRSSKYESFHIFSFTDNNT